MPPITCRFELLNPDFHRLKMICCALQVLVAASCTTSTAVYMDPGTAVGTLGVWQVVPRPAIPQLFPNGQYSINNVGRAASAGCTQTLVDATCANGNGVSMGTSGHTLPSCSFPPYKL